MRTDEALQRLAEYQGRITAEIEVACKLLAGEPERARAGLAKARWHMSRVLREYQLFKHGEIFDPAIARGTPPHAAMARRMKANCIAAGERHAAHVTRWSARDVAGEWAEYLVATRAMAAELRAHLLQEKRDVERFLHGSARTRRLAPPI